MWPCCSHRFWSTATTLRFLKTSSVWHAEAALTNSAQVKRLAFNSSPRFRAIVLSSLMLITLLDAPRQASDAMVELVLDSLSKHGNAVPAESASNRGPEE